MKCWDCAREIRQGEGVCCWDRKESGCVFVNFICTDCAAKPEYEDVNAKDAMLQARGLK